ncbi:hypothetical protein PybrP1_009939 [[Pythium] brassicae (nom. inval.)]|nr:hypothetical protein PybrP1_009939 [[Pythium] brassicae (nom. inval.)]
MTKLIEDLRRTVRTVRDVSTMGTLFEALCQLEATDKAVRLVNFQAYRFLGLTNLVDRVLKKWTPLEDWFAARPSKPGHAETTQFPLTGKQELLLQMLSLLRPVRSTCRIDEAVHMNDECSYSSSNSRLSRRRRSCILTGSWLTLSAASEAAFFRFRAWRASSRFWMSLSATALANAVERASFRRSSTPFVPGLRAQLPIVGLLDERLRLVVERTGAFGSPRQALEGDELQQQWGRGGAGAAGTFGASHALE